jgi:hypothetical protein
MTGVVDGNAMSKDEQAFGTWSNRGIARLQQTM